MRSWLYRIATNVCTDMLRSAQRRARPMELGPSSPPDESKLGSVPARGGVGLADRRRAGRCPTAPTRPRSRVARESIRLAFVTALQHLPAKQRAALILCEVLRWQAAEVAQLLDTSVAAVNSALQRARATMSALPAEARPLDVPDDNAALLARYVDAFERYDIESFVTLLHEDVIQSMPPFAMWLQGAENIGRWMLLPGPSACRGSRLLATSANGCPAFGQYRPDPAGGHYPWALQVLEISGGRISGLNAFLEPDRLFATFGLPAHLPA